MCLNCDKYGKSCLNCNIYKYQGKLGPGYNLDEMRTLQTRDYYKDQTWLNLLHWQSYNPTEEVIQRGKLIWHQRLFRSQSI